jgi:hypothetical protein
MSIDHYRPGFDVPFPLLPKGVATHATQTELQAADGNRHLLLSFKGVCHVRPPRVPDKGKQKGGEGSLREERGETRVVIRVLPA